MEKVVVTGGCGLLGRYVVDELASRFQVTVFDRVAPIEGTERAGCRYEVGDILDRGRVQEVMEGHNAVIHLAGIDIAIDAPDTDYYRTNVMGTWNTLLAAEQAGHRKVVVCSSVSALGLSDQAPVVAPEKLPADENQIPHPSHAYGISKQAMEVTARGFAARGTLDIVVLRPSFVIYPEILKDVQDHVIMVDVDGDAEATVGQLTSGSISPVRSYVRPDDAARCFRLALEVDTGAFELLYVLADDTYSPEPTLDSIQRRFGKLPADVDRVLYEQEPCRAALSNRRAGQVLGWRPTGNWAQFLRESGVKSA